ncbi:serine carboxypeptidase-like 17 [Artemisia annua]|uniref:Serine carboxypeptidase-like 17 n=1 Tax=Artemisia annua TaxID=35608 RepID=A0A2U1N3C1_ARTAN|nr:serine carboxypeptidase-like 17 [Artemisia annua]
MKPRSRSHLQPWDLYNKSRSRVSRMLFAVLVLIASMEVIESQFLVKTLPGFDGDLPFTLETGHQCTLSYIGVGESDEVQLFYYFIESERNPNEDPLMLWLTRGPGFSGLSGLFYEIGALTIDYANSTLEKARLEINPYSWTKATSIIFLDQPAGTGFTYAKTSEAYIINDTSVILKFNSCNALITPIYLGADSYAGLVAPMIVQEIYNGNEVGKGPHINIQGYVLGNPLTYTSADFNSRIPYAHNMALLSDAIYKSTKENCHGEYWNVDPNNSLCVHDLDVVDKDDNYLYSSVWANSKDVREALHIREYINHVTTRNLAKLNGGDHDMVVPYISTINWIESLNLPVIDDWRPWFVDEQVSGYTVNYSKYDYSLTFATVKGGGHTAPEYKPREFLSMIVRWLHKDTL